MILASNSDRAVTVRERDPTYPYVPRGPRGALVDEVNGDSICDQIPLPHGHGSVNFRFSMIPSSLKFQVSVYGSFRVFCIAPKSWRSWSRYLSSRRAIQESAIRPRSALGAVSIGRVSIACLLAPRSSPQALEGYPHPCRSRLPC